MIPRIRKGVYRTELRHLVITGRDLVGTVVEVGPGVADVACGDRVWTNSAGFEGRMGATAEYVGVDMLTRAEG